jgi:hypothetical protein
MNGMFSNSRGLGDLAKHVHIADCCRDHNLDFVAISDTSRWDFSPSLLNRLSGGIDFDWVSRPPRGRSGGIPVGVRAETMEILASSDGEFYIKLHIITKLIISHGFSLLFMVLLKMSLRLTFCVNWSILQKTIIPDLNWVDFNLLRFHHEKSKGHFDSHWPFLFNVVIDSLDLR